MCLQLQEKGITKCVIYTNQGVCKCRTDYYTNVLLGRSRRHVVYVATQTGTNNICFCQAKSSLGSGNYPHMTMSKLAEYCNNE